MHLTVPIFMEIALVVLVGFVDMLMLSSCGDGAVAAVGLASQIVTLVFLVYRFAASGVAVVCAQYHGARLRKRLIQVGTILFWVDCVLVEIGRIRNIFACGTLRAAGDVLYPMVVGVSLFQHVTAGNMVKYAKNQGT